MIVLYPWMPKELNPNARVHWATKAAKAKEYKKVCWAITTNHHLKLVNKEKVDLKLTFYKPTKVRRDLDNCLASFKAGLDGISLALGVDDSRFLLTIELAEEIGGYVKVNFNNERKQA